MHDSSQETIEYYQFPSLNGSNAKHAIFSRNGGVSPDPWRSLNVGGTVGDERENVEENKRRAFDAIGVDVVSVYDAWQIHSGHAIVVDKPRAGRPFHQADILLTATPNVTLFMRFADCVPILLYDPIQHVAGIVHTGWLGTVRKAASIAVQKMIDSFDSKPKDLLAGIGPSIGPDHYEVGSDVIGWVEATFSEQAGDFLHTSTSGTYMDLWAANLALLQDMGVEKIEVSGICTACDLDRWFSHRAEQGETGRFGAAISLI